MATIDIHHDKFLQWLTSRDLIEQKWTQHLAVVQKKIQAASALLPLHIQLQAREAAEGEATEINYFTCLRIVELLEKEKEKEQNADGKDAGKGSSLSGFLGGWKVGLGFGSTSEQRIYQWQTIIKEYQKKNLYLAEAARILHQNIAYDLPLLKKSIQTGDKQIVDLRKKVDDSERAAETLKKAYEKQCEALQIKADEGNVRDQIVRLASKLPKMLAKVQLLTLGDALGDAIEYYQAFSHFCLQVSDSKAKLPTLIPVVKKVREYTNSSQEKLEALLEEEEKQDEVKEEDWGISLEGSGSGGETTKASDSSSSTSDDTAENAGASITIDWGGVSIDDLTTIDESKDKPQEISIDWGISLEEGEPSETKEEEPEKGKKDKAKGKGKDKETKQDKDKDKPDQWSLMTHSTRQSFISELLELKIFLEERLFELTDDAQSAFSFASYVDSQNTVPMPALLRTQSSATLKAYLASVTELLDQLRDPDMAQLTAIQSSNRYVDRLVNGLRQQLKSAQRMEQAAANYSARRSDLLSSTQKARRKLGQLSRETKQLKEQAEKAISQLYDNRKVKIFGDIPTV